LKEFGVTPKSESAPKEGDSECVVLIMKTWVDGQKDEKRNGAFHQFTIF
jgi:hypothetical protein